MSIRLMAASVSARRQALADFARSRKGDESTGRLIGRIAMIIVILGLIGLAVLWLIGFFGTPKEVLAVRAAVDTQVVELQRVARGEVPYGGTAASFGPLMDTMRQVPDRYRDQARQEMGRLRAAQEAAEINSYFAIPPAQRAAELDRRIKAEEARRTAWEAERKQREASGGGSGNGSGRGQGNGPSSSGGQGSNGTGGQQASGGPRRRGDGTEESRNNWAKKRIDTTTAEGRARRTEYRRAADQRRIQLGLEPRR
jgi:uncharacterized membrane protein YgcG